jgi:putative intracellular protease/amidase
MRRLVTVVLGVVLSAVVLGATAAAGVTVSMRAAYPGDPGPAGPWPQARPAPPGTTVVAVVLGTGGTVVSDALLPYEAFARASGTFVYTVAGQRRPLALSGGLRVVPEYTFGNAPVPDVVVVPAVVRREPALEDWVRAAAARGAYVLGVCAGAEVLAGAGLLAGRRATSFWQRLGALRDDFPETDWVAGRRFVEDGRIVTTAGVTSGLAGSLRVIELLSGTAEAVRVGREVSYRDWRPGMDTGIAPRNLSGADLPYALNAAFPWLRPTVGIGLIEGAGEIDVAAAFETYAGTSFATRAVPIAARPVVTTRHGLLLTAGTEPVDRLIVPGTEGPAPDLAVWAAGRGIGVTFPHAARPAGEFAFDPLLRDLARYADRATARTTAKFTEYPDDHLLLTGESWPWRATAWALLVLALAVAAGFLPRLVVRHRSSAADRPVPVPGTDR